MEYLQLLGKIHRHLQPRTYVEIGVGLGGSFAEVLPDTKAIGVDPILRILSPVNGKAKFFPLESDDFFSKHDLLEELGAPVSLAFIDGMHLFEYALRDFTNIERCCSPESVILVHDCYPRTRESAAREATSDNWCGDVWKLMLCLKDYRPELQVSVLDVPPAGLGIVTGVVPRSTLLRSRYEEILARYKDLDYSFLDVAKDAKLNRVPNDWDLVQSLLETDRR